MPAPGSHYFDEEPTTESAPREVQLLLPDAQFALRTDRGVFGYDRIDSGTKLLLVRAPAPAPRGCHQHAPSAATWPPAPVPRSRHLPEPAPRSCRGGSWAWSFRFRWQESW